MNRAQRRAHLADLFAKHIRLPDADALKRVEQWKKKRTAETARLMRRAAMVPA